MCQMFSVEVDELGREREVELDPARGPALFERGCSARGLHPSIAGCPSRCFNGPMRVTVTLDDDVFAEAERMCREQGLKISAAINELARRGIAATTVNTSSRTAFKQRTKQIGIQVDVSNLGDVLDALDA